MLSVLFVLATVIFGLTSAKVIARPEAEAAPINDPTLNDSFIQILISTEVSNKFTNRQVFFIGLWATVGSACCFSLANMLKKLETVRREQKDSQRWFLIKKMI